MRQAREMQGVPAQKTVLRKPKGDKRRNIAWCRHSQHLGNRIYICRNEKCCLFNLECHSSKNCDYYVDSREEKE